MLLEDCKERGMMIRIDTDGGISRDAKPENVKSVVDAVERSTANTNFFFLRWLLAELRV